MKSPKTFDFIAIRGTYQMLYPPSSAAQAVVLPIRSGVALYFWILLESSTLLYPRLQSKDVRYHLDLAL